MPARSPALRFVPYGALNGAPNVVVDGSPAEGTVLCLSHWPRMESPVEFAADTSVEMTFSYLDAFDRHAGAHAVSNNHFDQDGLVAVFALTAPDEALARRELLMDVARAGDFATFSSLAATEAAIASGAVSISEVDDIDLAVVTVAPGAPHRGGHRFTGQRVHGLHPMAVYNATRRSAVLTIREQTYELTYRYEGWVQYRSHSVRPHVDLAPLAARLNAEETAAGTWVAQPVSALTPTLSLQGCAESGISRPRFRSLVESHLRGAPPAWDPFPPT